MSSTAPLLVLFDIDGTLILSGRAGVRGMNRAFERLYGQPRVLDDIPMAGRTDRAIASDAFRAIGRVGSAEELAALRDAYCDCLAVEITKPVTDPCGVLPGVVAVLDDLDTRRHVQMGLLTGNFERGAAIKLGHFDLARRFAFGAFGDHHVDRRDLVPVALAAAARQGVVASPARTIVIGDTPLDIDCARAHGLRAVGVATGPFTTRDLHEAGADLVLESLADLRRFAEWLEGIA